ncbi:hypothetical protein TCON_1022 [Astathelohania contejeani]|uniref:EF-hand domain-containing protein n=1 Tax=Astathelohania contejeani TaxID=164912 RepID=A0ABQ7I037_9MICR|nr:hypothetical protein TCON_1022 [Thelohania contejeani]
MDINEEIKKLVRKFDYGKKGYLTYQEYVGVALMLGIQPSPKDHMDEKIFDLKLEYEDDKSVDDVFNFIFVNGVMEISHLKRVCEMVGLKYNDTELKEMADYFELDGYEKFKRMFKNKLE